MIFFVLLGLALALVLGGALYAYRKAFYSPYQKRDYLHAPDLKRCDAYREDMERIFIALADSPFETVHIFSDDGLTLSGRYYHLQNGGPVDLCFHGYRSSPLTDMCCFAELAAGLHHNLLLVDQRAHGDSRGRTISFGIRERMDVLRWVDYALDRFGADVEALPIRHLHGGLYGADGRGAGPAGQCKRHHCRLPLFLPKKDYMPGGQRDGYSRLAVLASCRPGGKDLRGL